MALIIENWGLIVFLIALIFVIGYTVYTFMRRPRTEQIENIKQWLLFAVCEAEREFGANTGKIKLAYVYDQFIAKFPILAQVISFNSFSLLVDEVLVKFKNILSSNNELQGYVGVEVQQTSEE